MQDREFDPSAPERPALPEAVFTSRPVIAVASLLLLSAASYATPGLERLRVFSPLAGPSPGDAPMLAPVATVGESEVSLATEHRPELAQPENVVAPAAPRGPIAAAETELPVILAEKPPLPIVDAEHSLDRFFAALDRTARKEPGALTRILYYGDSAVASDFGTGTLRRKLQEQFGDGGHGFLLIANAWPAYFHNDVFRRASKGWKVSRMVGPYQADGLYGLGGVSFAASSGLRSLVGTTREGRFGRAVSRFVVTYLEQPGGGELRISIDGEPAGVIDTDGPVKKAGFREFRVPDGEHTLELLTARGLTRTFGFVLERDGPGVVLDALGVVGARIRFLDKIEDAHWAEQIRFRKPDLVAFQFGANESGDGFAYPMDEYHRTMKDVLVEVMRVAPEAGCLIVGALDRARKEGERLVTVPIIPHIVERQRKVAGEVGCAYFDTFTAMGGRGSMARWVRRGLGAGDFTHPTSYGADVIGKWIYGALMDRYAEYRSRSSPGQGPPP